MQHRPFATITLALLAASLGACSVVNDLDPYVAGGGDAATKDSTIDTGRDAPSDVVPDVTIDAADATDAGAEVEDSTVADSGVLDVADSTVTDATDAADTADTTVLPDTADAGDAPVGSCGTICGLGVSEIMAHVISGTGDKHEWVELTNYGTGTIDLSGATVKVFNSSSPPGEKAAFTFPAGTTLTAGEALVVADDDVTFKSDVTPGYVLGKVFSFAKPAGDVFINSAFYIRLYAAGSTLPYEDVYCSRGTWTLYRSYAYPIPSTACPASGRISSPSGTGSLTSTWKDSPLDPASKYGEFPTGVTSLYGSPTKANTGVTCP